MFFLMIINILYYFSKWQNIVEKTTFWKNKLIYENIQVPVRVLNNPGKQILI